MAIREPVVAGLFYPANADRCHRELERYVGRARQDSVTTVPCAGIVPHAGWTYSGPTAAYTFVAIAHQTSVETIVLFGAVHSWGVMRPSLFGSGAWRSPLGDVAIDEELAEALLRTAPSLLVNNPAAHREEHSIEVQVPFIQYLFPQARILPIALPPLDIAPAVGEHIARVSAQLGRQVVAIGSSDLTHYGPRYGMAPAGIGEPGLLWARQNDQRILHQMEAMEAGNVLKEAEMHHNACGPGAIAATIGFAAARGATKGIVLHYTTSHDAAPQDQPTDSVGYGALAFA